MRNPKKKFGKIYDKYVKKIYRFIFLKVSSQEAAEDLTAQVFTKGWKRFRTSQDIENPSAYLYQVARAELADYYRKRNRFQIISIEADSITDPQPSMEENQQAQSDIEMMRTSLSKLNDDEQNVVIWRYLDGLSFKEIAQIMERPEGTIRVMLHRALKELREKMNR